jgi:hypothetical protein
MTAKVTFLPHDQGGFARPHGSGVKPQLKVKDHTFTSCIVWGESPDQVFEPGVEYAVSLELPLWEHYRNDLYAGMPLQLNDGSRIVARGTILSITGPG